MKYFQLVTCIRAEVGSTFPQSQEFNSAVNVDAPNHIWNVYGKFPVDIYIPELILHPNAKVTDEISTSVFSRPVFSDKVKNILSQYRNTGVEYFPVKLIVKNEELDYWVMNTFEKDYQYIDFEKTDVKIKNWEDFSKTKIEIKNPSELERAIAGSEIPHTLLITKLCLIDDIQDELIFIDFVEEGRTLYFSERLVHELMDAGVTGMEFKALEVC